MKQFKDFGIQIPEQGFIGDSIKMSRILNRTIVLLDWKIEKSNFDKGTGQRLTLQIEISGKKHIVWTGSGALMEMIQKVPKNEFPIETTIMEDESKRLYFS